MPIQINLSDRDVELMAKIIDHYLIKSLGVCLVDQRRKRYYKKK